MKKATAILLAVFGIPFMIPALLALILSEPKNNEEAIGLYILCFISISVGIIGFFASLSFYKSSTKLFK